MGHDHSSPEIESQSHRSRSKVTVNVVYVTGTILNRHRVPKPAPDDDQYYRADDLNIGVELNLHSRVVKLVNCDDFTRNFLQKLGVRLNPPIQIPADPYSCERKAVSVAELLTLP